MMDRIRRFGVHRSERDPMLMSSVLQAWGTLDRKSALLKLIAKFFLKGVVFMFWHDTVYIELLSCVTNF